MSILNPFELKKLLIKVAIVVGVIIVMYGILWLLAILNLIPPIIASLFPQVVIIIIGLFIIYTAINKKNDYY